jgi:hypothetical protein
MFTTVQNISQNAQIAPKTVVFVSGMRLAKSKKMKLQVTYREITMIFGILIAIVMMFTLWVRKPEIPGSSIQSPSKKVSSIAIPAAKSLIEASAEIVSLIRY